MKKYTFILLCLLCNITMAQVHPVTFATRVEFKEVLGQLSKNQLLNSSYSNIKSEVDSLIKKGIDVPVPKDPAGGYTHDQHKSNYTLMYEAGLLYQISGEKKYAAIVKDLFLKYAELNPTLKNHPQATSASPGRLFWQALNDANWLVYTGMAYDLIQEYLTPSEKNIITKGAFKPIVDYFIVDQKKWFNLIHNHAVWACAGVGIVGIATDNDEYLQKALYGTEKDGKAGFLANLKGLFSPDGFYHEGPYYTRYALLPFYLFANAVNHVKPSLSIFQYRDSILKKALDVALNQTNISGEFFSYNDALKDKTYISNELVVAIDIAWQVYGSNSSWLSVAQSQNRVILNKGGIDISKKIAALKGRLNYPYHSAEYTDGSNGDFGGLSILRNGTANDLSTLLFKYTSHGLSHGHYDKLNIQFYDKGNEVLQDYGAVRYINIEHKWGGRYLPETNSFAQQTIAHNTITIDETSHYNGKENVAELSHPNRLFGFVKDGASLQVVAAMDSQSNPGSQLFRTEYLIKLPTSEKKLLVDVFRVVSNTSHQYDMPFYFLGTPMKTNFPYNSFQTSLTTLGTKNGYQHLWKEAEANRVAPFTQFTFLNNKTFYTISSLSDDSVNVIFARIGASDPNFNLRRDPSYIIRSFGKNKTFINVIEVHGNFSAVTEIANNSFSSVGSVVKLIDNESYTVSSIEIDKKTLLIFQCNKNFGEKEAHTINIGNKQYSWEGPYYVEYDNRSIN
jgi:hypothetical protein